MTRTLLFLSLMAVASNCAPRPHETAEPRGETSDTSVRLHDHALVVHAIAAPTHTSGPLILYVTGDGGWSADLALFNQMIPWGYPTAGVSAADYVSHLDTQSGTIAPNELANDYLAIIDAARRSLALAVDTRVVLVGLSRGSGLDVAAAGDPRLQSLLKGVLAIALTGEEEYVEEPRPPAITGVMLQTYEALPRLGNLPVAVIQSTRDQYLPAGEARRRFGPDSPSRRFRAIDAADHGFGGKLSELYREMKDGFDWIMGTKPV